MADGNSLEQQAQSGNMDAQFQLGVQYLYGTNVDKDTSKAAEWFTKAAAQGHVPAIRELGILIASGDGVDPDPEKGAELLGRASPCTTSDSCSRTASEFLRIDRRRSDCSHTLL